MSSARAQWRAIFAAALLSGFPLGHSTVAETPWRHVERAGADVGRPPVSTAAAAPTPDRVTQNQPTPFRWGYFGARHFSAPASWHRGFTGEVSTWRVHR